MRVIQGIIIFIFAAFILAVSLIGEEDKNASLDTTVTKATAHKENTQETTASEETKQEKKIPENFILNNDSKMFEPVTFPHEMHTEFIDDCTICHHNSIEGQTPSCKTCHGKPFDPKNSELLGKRLLRSGLLKDGLMKFFDPETPENLERPGLTGAYHQRCMGCHREYDSGPVDCFECHEKK